MSVIVSTSNYEFTHGKKPRGRGYWCFDIAGKDFWVPKDGSGEGAVMYSEAKKRAVSEAVKQNVYQITVLT